MTKKYFFIFLFFECTFPLYTQTITTLAGTGTPGLTGNNGPAILAQLAFPRGVAVDHQGCVYIADQGNNRIRKINKEGLLIVLAGNGMRGEAGDGGQAINAQLFAPQTIALDREGNVYIADEGNNKIRKVDTSGIITTIAGNGIKGFGGDGGSAIKASLNTPSGVAVDSIGNIFIADRLNNRIRVVNGAGHISTYAGTGIAGFSGDGNKAVLAAINDPTVLACDPIGNLYFTDGRNNRIRKINTQGIISSFAGNGRTGNAGNGGLAIDAELTTPSGLAIDQSGIVYISCKDANNVRKVNTAGVITLFAGTGDADFGGDGKPAILSKLHSPRGLAVDTYGDLIIADYENHRIRKICTSTCTTPLETEFVEANIAYGPNPTKGRVTIRISGQTSNFIHSIEVFDQMGKMILLHGPLGSNTHVTDIHSYPSGVYYFKINMGNTFKIFKIIKN